jgi:cytokinin dehydrogenase
VSPVIDRRKLLQRAGVAGLVLAFDPRNRRWVHAAERGGHGDPVPPLDGVLLTDRAARDADSTDTGAMVTRQPWAVLRPGSVRDIAAMVCYCRTHGLAVAARGQAHSVFGQPLVDGGLVIETAPLAQIHSITAGAADVDAGATWRSLLAATLSHGQTPPVLTGFIGLSLGGTLSMGGISTRTDQGAQVDRVRRIQVVTGEGRVTWCSATEDPDLFFAVLAGLGQFGVITRAVVDLVPAPDRVRYWVLQYLEPAAFFADLRTLLDRAEFDHVYGQIGSAVNIVLPDANPAVPLASVDALRRAEPLLSPVLRAALSPAGRALVAATEPVPGDFVYQLHLAKHYGPDPAADDTRLLRALNDLPVLRQRFDSTYEDFALRVDGLIEVLQVAGLWNGVPHPWIDNFLPGHAAEPFITETVGSLQFDDISAIGFSLLFPQRRSSLTRPSLMVPDSDPDWVMLFDILTSAPGPNPGKDFVEKKLARNRRIFEAARSIGGKVYPISAVALDREDWAHHYGSRYSALTSLKAVHDPDGILTPGFPVF